MKVKSKLADVDFQFGYIERKDNTLVISNDPSQSMRSRVYVTPDDVMRFIGKLFRSPSALLFFLGFPYFYWRARKEPPKTR
jgi:hypothetical protein